MNDNFDWYGYYELANSYLHEEDIAKLRTGMGRFYYSSFLESRDFILENNLFLNHINEKNNEINFRKSASGNKIDF